MLRKYSIFIGFILSSQSFGSLLNTDSHNTDSIHLIENGDRVDNNSHEAKELKEDVQVTPLGRIASFN